MSSKVHAPSNRRDLVTVEELAAEFPVSRDWIYQLVRDGKIEHRRFGRRVAISRTAFDALTRRNAEQHVGSDLS